MVVDVSARCGFECSNVEVEFTKSQLRVYLHAIKIRRSAVNVSCEHIAYMVAIEICFVSNFFLLEVNPTCTPFVRCVLSKFLLMKEFHVS